MEKVSEAVMLKKKHECLVMKAKGMMQKDIAKALEVTEKTVGKWVNNTELADLLTIRKKLIVRYKKMCIDVNVSISDMDIVKNHVAYFTSLIYRELKKQIA